MKPYSEFKPTEYDYHINVEEQENWLVAPVTTNRDADLLIESNWEIFCKHLEENYAEYTDYQIHRFGHWGPGWFELILINPECASLVKYAEECESALSGYPVLDEGNYSQKQWEYCRKYITDNFDLSEDDISKVMDVIHISDELSYSEVETTIKDLHIGNQAKLSEVLATLKEHPYQALDLDINTESMDDRDAKDLKDYIQKFLDEHDCKIPTLRDTDELSKLENYAKLFK